MRNSPIARTPPKNLPNIPGVTSPAVPNHPKENGDVVREKKPEQKQVDAAHCDDPQFEMDIWSGACHTYKQVLKAATGKKVPAVEVM